MNEKDRKFKSESKRFFPFTTLIVYHPKKKKIVYVQFRQKFIKSRGGVGRVYVLAEHFSENNHFHLFHSILIEFM